MSTVQIITTVIFLITIGLIISRLINSVAAALLGVVVMIVAGIVTEVEAFGFVDWNVIAILISIWIIAGYFGKTGIPEYLAARVLKFANGNLALFVTLIGTLAGFLSMFVDNIVVILMMAPVLFEVSRKYKFKTFAPLLFIGLCANFMGTALLLGDLPPQLLHSVTGIEFNEFIWQDGRPSSFIILTITYLIVVSAFYFIFKKYFRDISVNLPDGPDDGSELGCIKDRRFAFIVCFMFAATITLMSMRQLIGFRLGFLALLGAIVLVLLLEVFKKPLNLQVPDFEEVLGEVQWDAVFFYSALFALVGALEHTGVIKIAADMLTPYLQASLLGGVSLLYWVTAPIVAFVEHDAYILALLYIIRDFAHVTGINPWPYYWALLFAGTLGSNLTIAGAPALYVALSMSEKEDNKKVTLKEFLSWSAKYATLSLVICFVLLVFIWVLPLQ